MKSEVFRHLSRIIGRPSRIFNENLGFKANYSSSVTDYWWAVTDFQQRHLRFLLIRHGLSVGRHEFKMKTLVFKCELLVIRHGLLVGRHEFSMKP